MRQNFIGLVVSQGKMSKTVKVRVQIPVQNSQLNMVINKRRDFLVHDEGEICREGDVVRIESTRPLSARKFFAVAEIKNPTGQEFMKYSNIIELDKEYEEFLKLHRYRLVATPLEYGSNGEVDEKFIQETSNRPIPFTADGMPLYFHRLPLQVKHADDFYRLYHRQEFIKQQNADMDRLLFVVNQKGENLTKDEVFWADLRAYKLLALLGDNNVADPALLGLLSEELKEKYSLKSWPPDIALPSTSLRTHAQSFSEKARSILSTLDK